MFDKAMAPFGGNFINERYENYIGGEWVAPVKSQYFDNISPVTGKAVCQVARGTAEDIELALDAAHKAKDAWGRMAPAERANILNRVADRMEQNLDMLALVETIDNGNALQNRGLHDARERRLDISDARALRTGKA